MSNIVLFNKKYELGLIKNIFFKICFILNFLIFKPSKESIKNKISQTFTKTNNIYFFCDLF